MSQKPLHFVPSFRIGVHYSLVRVEKRRGIEEARKQDDDKALAGRRYCSSDYWREEIRGRKTGKSCEEESVVDGFWTGCWERRRHGHYSKEQFAFAVATCRIFDGMSQAYTTYVTCAKTPMDCNRCAKRSGCSSVPSPTPGLNII